MHTKPSIDMIRDHDQGQKSNSGTPQHTYFDIFLHIFNRITSTQFKDLYVFTTIGTVHLGPQ